MMGIIRIETACNCSGAGQRYGPAGDVGHGAAISEGRVFEAPVWDEKGLGKRIDWRTGTKGKNDRSHREVHLLRTAPHKSLRSLRKCDYSLEVDEHISSRGRSS